jgi:hypothetical protein
MALTSVFYDGPVTETDRAKNRGGVPDYGVYGVGDFEVKAHPSIPYNVLVKAGRAHGHGVTDTAAGDQVVPCNTLASGTRWDLIVVRRNWQPALGGPSTLVSIPGGTTPAIPAARKVGPGIEDDQPIALVKWQGGLSAPAQIIDLRVWASNGGLYAKDDLVRTYLTGVGTEVNINGTLWALQLGTNDAEGWARSTPSVVRVAGVSGTAWIQAGEVQVTTNQYGVGFINFPEKFPGGLSALVISDSTLTPNSGVEDKAVTCKPMVSASSGSQGQFLAFTAAGALPGKSLYVNYIAAGR